MPIRRKTGREAHLHHRRVLDGNRMRIIRKEKKLFLA
jgi:hypothetical protein